VFPSGVNAGATLLIAEVGIGPGAKIVTSAWPGLLSAKVKLAEVTSAKTATEYAAERATNVMWSLLEKWVEAGALTEGRDFRFIE
jgi:hypothetical protein